MPFFDHIENYFENLADRFKREFEERRRADRRQELADEVTHTHSSNVSIRIESIDFLSKSNAANHHCEKYEVIERVKDTSVIRRGGTVSIEVTFNQECDFKKHHSLKFYFSFGSSPNVHHGTQVILEVCGKTMFDKSHEEWDIRITEINGKKVKLEIQVETDAAVGVWNVAATTCERNNHSTNQVLRLDHLIYILFNPWNKNDSTYLPDEEQRKEYVLNDVGKVWVGSYREVKGRHWIFGQFDVAVLPACVLLMEKARVKPEARGDPIKVSRAISRIVNSNDDDGVLKGNWTEDYSDGTAPLKWTGSIPILEQYVRFKKTVKYGQCWVFAGVVNTVCRALGLPSRVVTNLNSAHDTNGSLTMDKYFNKRGEDITTDIGKKDSLWNFHVWNDVWMTRPDLPPGYGGWQAIDATPQEASDGVFQCGPASHEAVRRGDIHLKYDVPYVLAEVNADVVKWLLDENDTGFKKMNVNTKYVGHQVITKKIGEVANTGYDVTDREEITMEYKAKEGSKAERHVMYSAAKRSKAAREAYQLPPTTDEDVEFSIVDIDRVPIGDDFSITVKAKNKSDKIRTVSVVLTACSTYYTGTKAYDIARAEGDFVLKPNETQTLTLPVTYNLYYKKLVEYAMVKLLALCNVEETSYSWVGEDTFQVLKPNVKIEVLTEPVVSKALVTKLSFTNPLPISLKNCSLMVDAPGIMRPKTIPVKDVGPKAEMTYELNMYPQKETSGTIVATFNSNELVDLTGSTNVVILKAEE